MKTIPAAFLMLCLLLNLGCKETNSTTTPETKDPVSVSVQEISLQPFQATEEIVGTVRAGLRATIEAKVNGKINQMYVGPGQLVSKGQVLTELDVKEIQAKLDQALAMQDQAERDLKRANTLLSQQAIARSDYDAAQSKDRVAKAAVEEAETMLSYSKVTAPYNGIITKKLADIGDLAIPGKPLLEMEDPSALQIEVEIPEGLISYISLSQKLPVILPKTETPVEGTVVEISPSANPNSRTFLAKLDLVQVPELRTGVFVRVAIPTGERQTIQVPNEALIQRGQLELVFVTDKTSSGENIARLKIVKTGKRLTEQTEIVSGIKAGDKLVTKNADKLVDGQTISFK